MAVKASFQLKTSFWCLIALVSLHAVAITVLFFLPWPKWALGLLAGLCILSLVYTLLQHVFHYFPWSIVRFDHVSAKIWRLQTRKGQANSAILLYNSVSTNNVVILNFKYEQRWWPSISVVVTQDSLAKEDFRHLRVRLQTQ